MFNNYLVSRVSNSKNRKFFTGWHCVQDIFKASVEIYFRMTNPFNDSVYSM